MRVINERAIFDAVHGAFEATGRYYADAQLKQIWSVVWTWDNETQRLNGEIVFSPRDIADAAKMANPPHLPLADSLEFWQLDPNTVYYIYRAKHAAFVHMGTSQMPARPWTLTALEEEDVFGFFVRELQARWEAM